MGIAIALNLLHDVVEEGALGRQPTCQPQSLHTQAVPTAFQTGVVMMFVSGDTTVCKILYEADTILMIL